MFSLFRSTIPKRLVAKYSTDEASSGWGLITDLLDEASKEQISSPAVRRHVKWRPFAPNTVVRPHDLTYQSRLIAPPLPRRRAVVGPPPSVARYTDVFHQFDIDPLSVAENPHILASFLSEMGKIYSRNITGLTSRSQRKMGKAIRRAKMMGVIPVLSRPSNIYSIYSKR